MSNTLYLGIKADLKLYWFSFYLPFWISSTECWHSSRISLKPSALLALNALHCNFMSLGSISSCVCGSDLPGWLFWLENTCMERKAESIKNIGTLVMSGRAKARRRTSQKNSRVQNLRTCSLLSKDGGLADPALSWPWEQVLAVTSGLGLSEHA